MKQRSALQSAVYEILNEEDGTFSIQRNGRYLMTPAGRAYRVESQALAQAVLQEWQSQGEKIVPATMPLTQLLATAFDVVGPDREKTIRGLLAFVDSELLCHQATYPQSLIARQLEVWQPFLDWCKTQYGIVWACGGGVMPVRQDKGIEGKLRAVLEAMDDKKLAGVSVTADTAGSLILALALAEGFKDAQAIFAAAELDSTHQAETWGQDPETQSRKSTILSELQACERWFGVI